MSICRLSISNLTFEIRSELGTLVMRIIGSPCLNGQITLRRMLNLRSAQLCSPDEMVLIRARWATGRETGYIYANIGS